MYRKWLLTTSAVVLLLVAVPVGLLGPVLFPSTSRVTRENAERLREGMTRAEVEEIIGTPGDYRTGPNDVYPYVEASSDSWTPLHPRGVGASWHSDEVELYIQADPGEVCRFVQLRIVKREELALDELVRWRLARWWERMFGPKP